MVVTASALNVHQVYQLLLNNGANQSEAATLAGISVWEAGGGNPNNINPAAINPVAPDYSVGLFQYNFRYPGGFNASNPLASTRGGYSAQELLDSLNAQAQSALALLRGSGHNYASQWSTYTPHLSSIQGYVNQLLNTSIAGGSAIGGGTTDTTVGNGSSETGTGDTIGGTGVQTTVGSSGLQSSPQASGTMQATASGTSGSNPTSATLSFSDTIQHSIVQLLLILVGIALLLGGIYLIGRPKL